MIFNAVGTSISVITGSLPATEILLHKLFYFKLLVMNILLDSLIGYLILLL